VTESMTLAELRALPAALDLRTAARALGIGRTLAYELARTGQFPCTVLRVGSHYRVPTAALLRALGVDVPSSATDSGIDAAGGVDSRSVPSTERVAATDLRAGGGTQVDARAGTRGGRGASMSTRVPPAGGSGHGDGGAER
jgi:hypothetical protein